MDEFEKARDAAAIDWVGNSDNPVAIVSRADFAGGADWAHARAATEIAGLKAEIEQLETIMKRRDEAYVQQLKENTELRQAVRSMLHVLRGVEHKANKYGCCNICDVLTDLAPLFQRLGV